MRSIVLEVSIMADRKLKIDIRRNAILQKLRQVGRVTVSQLSAEFGATEVTIRNDLSALEQDGYLMRVQGGAILAHVSQNDTNADRNIPFYAQKTAIAEAVSNMIHDGDTLFINSGTTTACVANALKKRQNIKIVTNSLAVATALGDSSNLRVTLLGGDINARYGFTYGGIAQELLSTFQANWAILSVDGISPTGGITTYHAEEAILDRMMIEGASHTLIVADSTKIGRVGFSRVCDCLAGITLVTNAHNASENEPQLTESGVQIILA